MRNGLFQETDVSVDVGDLIDLELQGQLIETAIREWCEDVDNTIDALIELARAKGATDADLAFVFVAERPVGYVQDMLGEWVQGVTG